MEASILCAHSREKMLPMPLQAACSAQNKNRKAPFLPVIGGWEEISQNAAFMLRLRRP